MYFEIKIARRRFYTQVISRILYLDMYLSGMIFTYHLKREPLRFYSKANSLAQSRVYQD